MGVSFLGQTTCPAGYLVEERLEIDNRNNSFMKWLAGKLNNTSFSAARFARTLHDPSIVTLS